MKCFVLALLLMLPALGLAQTDFGKLESQWQRGQFSSAQSELKNGESLPENADQLTWSYRLETDPDQAARIFTTLMDRLGNEDPQLRADLLADYCWRLFADAQYDSALSVMLHRSDSDQQLSMNFPLLQGLLLLQTQRRQSAEDVFNSIDRDDVDYGWAQLQLARIAINAEDPQRARSHVDKALDARQNICRPDALALLWSLTVATDAKRAKAIEQELSQDYGTSFAAATVAQAAGQRERLLSRTVDVSAIASAIDTTATRLTGDYILELSRYTDRGRALADLDRWHDYLEDMRVEARKTARGHMEYRLVGGRFSSRSQASMMSNRVFGDVDISPAVVDVRSGW